MYQTLALLSAEGLEELFSERAQSPQFLYSFSFILAFRFNFECLHLQRDKTLGFQQNFSEPRGNPASWIYIECSSHRAESYPYT